MSTHVITGSWTAADGSAPDDGNGLSTSKQIHDLTVGWSNG